jgi:hypothetical protein
MLGDGRAMTVKDGLIMITSESSGPDEDGSSYEDRFLLIGHCFLALLSAALGDVLAPLVGDPRSEQSGPDEPDLRGSRGLS